MTLHIVVVGGGYSGLIAAKLTARWTDADVTLVNASDRFVERVRLHQHATGQQLKELPLEDLLKGTGVQLIVDRVTAIDAETKTVLLENGTVHYDMLIYALGSQAGPGTAQAYSVSSFAEAERLRKRLTQAQTVAVVGGGLTGIEAAAELAETHPRLKVRLLTGGDLGAALSRRGRQYLRRTFERLGVDVRDNVAVEEVREDGVVLEGGEHVAADTVVWTAGFRVPEMARESGFAVDGNGRMIVDEQMRSVSHPDVYAVGDAAAVRRPGGDELRMACATGLPVAQHAARSIAARLNGRESKPLRFRYVNQCISLGRRDGLIQFVRSDDSPVEAVLTGRPAALYKEAVVRGTVLFQRHPTLPTSM
jgi:NADH:ubiquinone reductase (H+-translocating)